MLQLIFQLAALLVFVRVDVLHALAELGDVVAEGLQQYIHRLLVGLAELLRLLGKNLRREALEVAFEVLDLLGATLLGLGALLLGTGTERRNLLLGGGGRYGQRLLGTDAALAIGRLLGARSRQFLLRSAHITPQKDRPNDRYHSHQGQNATKNQDIGIHNRQR